MPGKREKGLEQLSKGTPSCKVSMGSRQGDWRSLSISWGEVVSKGQWCYNLGAAPSSWAPRSPFLGGAQLVQKLACCLTALVLREHFISLWVLRTHGHSCPEAGWAACPAVRRNGVVLPRSVGSDCVSHSHPLTRLLHCAHLTQEKWKCSERLSCLPKVTQLVGKSGTHDILLARPGGPLGSSLGETPRDGAFPPLLLTRSEQSSSVAIRLCEA